MPTYKITDPSTGKTVKLTGDSPPSESELNEVFASLGGAQNVPRGTFSASEMVRNIPGSAVEYGKAVAQPLLHPIDTAKGLYNLSSGLVQMLVPGEQGNEQYAKALGDHLKQRYGGIDKIKQTIEKDPVGFLGDVSTIFVAGGAALKAGGLAKAGSVVSKAGTVAEPLNAALLPARAGVKALAASKVPEKMYISAVKPEYTKKKGLEKFKAEAKAGLEEGIMPNESGLEKLNDAVRATESKVDDAIQATGGRSYTISSDEALKYVPDVIAEYEKKSIVPSQSKTIIKEAADSFIAEHGNFVDLQHVIDLKKGLYEDLRGKYGRQTTAPSELVDTYKATARGLKDAVYNAVQRQHPELKALAEREGALLGLKGAIEQGALRIAKRDIMGIGVPVKVGVGTAIGSAVGSPAVGTIVGAIAGIVDTPTVKARLAIALKTAQKKSLIGKYGQARLAAYQAGKASTIQQEGE